jgi:hypothetical protein
MQHTFNDFKSYYEITIFRHVTVAATTIIRGSLPFKLKHRHYKALFALLCTRNKIHFITFTNVQGELPLMMVAATETCRSMD